MITVCILVSVFLVPSSRAQNDTEGRLYKSSFGMELLLKREEYLVEEMEDVIASFGNQTNDLTIKLNRYVGRYKRTLAQVENVSDILAHPINGFHFVKDVVVDWISITNLYQEEGNQEYVEIINKLMKIRNESQYPSLSDVDQVAVSICAMQRTYDLQIVDLIVGDIVDETTDTVFKSLRPMNSWDCLVFGRSALSYGWYNLAVDWMEASQLLNEYNDKSVNIAVINENLQDAVKKHDSTLLRFGHIGPTWETHTFTIDEELMEQRRDQFGSPIAEFHPGLYTFMSNTKLSDNRNRLCQGQHLREPYLDDELVCRYLGNNDSYLLIGPFKIEEKSHDPAVILYHDFINEEEAEQLKELAGKNQKDSRYTFPDKNVSIQGLSRVSKETLLFFKSYPEMVSRISRRVEAATKLNGLAKGEYAALKVINYGIAGHYETHKDFYQLPDIPNDENERLQPDGDRISTFLIYLNDVKAGGATVFPYTGVTAWPKKLSALFWYNLHKSGVPDEFTLHSGCPVLYGEKWVMAQWQFVDPQTFTAPCGLHEHEKHTLL